jgi:transcriptional regulator with XRE-family HTH domain
MTFSGKLIRLRRRRGLSQEALAEVLGVSRQAVSRWEQGTALPDGAKLLPCARYFGVSVDWLLDEEQDWEDQMGPAPAAAERPGPWPGSSAEAC